MAFPVVARRDFPEVFEFVKASFDAMVPLFLRPLTNAWLSYPLSAITGDCSHPRTNA